MSAVSAGVGRALGVVLLVAIAVVSVEVRAQPSTREGGEAARLFVEGKALLEAKRYDEACPKLAESDGLDPSVGTMGLLAACYEGHGRLATAYRAYLETVKRARIAADARGDYAAQRAAALRPRVPVLVLRADPARKELSLSVDDAAVRAGEELLVDPGTHSLKAREDRARPWSMEVSVMAGERREVVVPEAVAVPESDARVATARPAPVAPAPAPARATPRGDGRRVAAFVLLGVGGAAVTAAAITGVMVLDRQDTVERECPQERCDTRAGYDAAQDGQTLVVVNAIAWSAGALALGTGAVLLVTSSSPPSTATASSIAAVGFRGGAGLSWRGSF